LLALANSRAFKYLVEIQCAFGAYEIGTIQRTPLPPCFLKVESSLHDLGKGLLREFSWLERLDETDVFFQNWLVGSSSCGVTKLAARIEAECALRKTQAEQLLQKVEAVVCEAYRIGLLEDTSQEHEKMLEVFDLAQVQQLVARLVVSVSLGCLFGRFPARGMKPAHFDPDYLAELPAGKMVGALASESSPCSNEAMQEAIVPDDLDHSQDIVRRVRDVFDLIWHGRAETVEKEACEILGVKELRDYFRKPGKGGFWDDHVARYSKSRRKAPIYWLLQSSKKNYALWLYYHRLDKDILFKALLSYVEPKIRLEQSRLDTLRAQRSALGDTAKGAKKIAKDIERQEALLGEIEDFEEKLRRAANLDFGKNLDSSVIYDPDLNDGVVLNIAPLWELVPWKEAKSYWDELLAGKYEWSSMGKLLRKKGLVK
jgi:hypothetical protein